ncbi:hypothetical protein MWU49_09820 [Alcanivorax sp. S6407]|uniref:hypothetical protein n=1 Tax=Alcanivorax sp. S6407 TaxID=2926424 RepID=UPI001FF16D88|nr:hypothetical protein [Alcanivorax sp. S6407]MCK0153999.1 hypothetical protein [Alcanivorax sp. S6407]
MKTLKAGVSYFFLTFAIGFALALIRIPFLVPRLGERWAELLELPFMVLASVLVARWLVGRFALVSAGQCIGAGVLALIFMLAAEIVMTLAQGRRLEEYLWERDPVSGSAYYLALLLFAVMPLLVRRCGRRQP